MDFDNLVLKKHLETVQCNPPYLNGRKPTCITKEEMQNLIKLAKALHINLVPEIDTPGHAL